MYHFFSLRFLQSGYSGIGCVVFLPWLCFPQSTEVVLNTMWDNDRSVKVWRRFTDISTSRRDAFVSPIQPSEYKETLDPQYSLLAEYRRRVFYLRLLFCWSASEETSKGGNGTRILLVSRKVGLNPVYRQVRNGHVGYICVHLRDPEVPSRWGNLYQNSRYGFLNLRWEFT